MRIAGLGRGRFQKRRIKQLGPSRPAYLATPPRPAPKARTPRLPCGNQLLVSLGLVSPTLDRFRASLILKHLEYSCMFFSLLILPAPLFSGVPVLELVADSCSGVPIPARPSRAVGWALEWTKLQIPPRCFVGSRSYSSVIPGPRYYLVAMFCVLGCLGNW